MQSDSPGSSRGLEGIIDKEAMKKAGATRGGRMGWFWSEVGKPGRKMDFGLELGVLRLLEENWEWGDTS